ncbi:MAG: hypothetical protein AB1630_12035 [bacterium]
MMEGIGGVGERCGCIAIREEGFVSLALKLKNEDVLSIPFLLVSYRFELYKLPTYPIIRLYLELSDRPEKDPIKAEALFFLEKDKEMLDALSIQSLLNLHFFNEENKYVSSKEIPFFVSQRDILKEARKDAEDFLSSLLKPNINHALKDFYSSFPL